MTIRIPNIVPHIELIALAWKFSLDESVRQQLIFDGDYGLDICTLRCIVVGRSDDERWYYVLVVKPFCQEKKNV